MKTGRRGRSKEQNRVSGFDETRLFPDHGVSPWMEGSPRGLLILNSVHCAQAPACYAVFFRLLVYAVLV